MFLLMVGTDFPYRVFYPKECTGHPGGHPRRAPRQALRRHPRTPWTRASGSGGARSSGSPRKPKVRISRPPRRESRSGRRAWIVAFRLTGKHRPMHPQTVTAEVSRQASDDAIFTVDVGECTVWAARHLRLRRRPANDRILQSRFPGFGLPAGPRCAVARSEAPGHRTMRRWRLWDELAGLRDGDALRMAGERHCVQQRENLAS